MWRFRIILRKLKLGKIQPLAFWSNSSKLLLHIKDCGKNIVIGAVLWAPK